MSAASTKPEADATVVICAYSLERWDDLIAAVESVAAQTVAPRQLVLVIDHNDELLARARERFPDLTVTANAREQGISGARNTGIGLSQTEVVVFLDDDAVAEPDWLQTLLAPYAESTVLGVGGQILPLWRFGRPDWFPAEFNWVVGCSYTGLPTERAPVRNPIGASLSARRAVLESVGGFDHSMGHTFTAERNAVSGTCDETELCIRASRHWPGHHWLYEPAARVHHLVPPSRLSWRYFVGRCKMEGTAKALLTGMAGAEDSLASERTYVGQVLPRGVLREAGRALRGDRDALARAGAIVAGLSITAATYLRLRVVFALRILRGATD